MLTKKVDTEELRNQLVRDTKVVGVSIFFGEKDQVGIKLTDGKILYTVINRLYWISPYKKKRTLSLTSFGQLIPGLNFDQVTFYGLFLKPNNMKRFYNELSVLAKKLRTEILKNVMLLNFAIDKIDNLAKEGKTEKKISYIKLKSYKRRGHDWLTRPYHFTKGISLYEEWLLSKERKSTIEYRRASKIFYKGKKQRTICKYPYKVKRYMNWSGEKLYPKLFKKFFGYRTPEYKVLGKAKWKIPGEKRCHMKNLKR